jgi:hypothetical protein
MGVFLVLNMFENIIHFSIGRNINEKNNVNIKIELPEYYDIIKIIFIMMLFAFLQAIFTYYFIIDIIKNMIFKLNFREYFFYYFL